VKILFVKESQNWPRASGHDVHGFHMMHSLAQLGHNISLLTAHTANPTGIQGIDFEWLETFGDLPIPSQKPTLSKLQSKFCSYWGIDMQRPQQIEELVRDKGFDAVVVVGLHVLPYLACVKNAVRVWYAADEWLLHHWSQFKLAKNSTWGNLKEGLVKGLYEFAFSRCTDRVWVVSKKDASTARWVMPRSSIDVIANGVDADHFDPSSLPSDSEPLQTRGLVFWGRLDFGPNIDAIDWFCRNVWTKLVKQRPDIDWTVYGFQAGKEVRALAAEFGFKLVPDLPDLRSEIMKHKVVVLPFVSGAGIKNKFLEAAAMARPIVASKRALNGVELYGERPCCVASNVTEWMEHIVRLHDSEAECKLTGEKARLWVMKNYSWERAAKLAANSLDLHC
jgi:glycosyltransferase involved in cell wall biosynthesis